MARIPYVDVASLPAPLQAILAARPPLNIFRMLPHAVTAAPGFFALGRALLTESELDPVWREMVIIRVGILSHADYEVHQHKQVARSVGMPEDKIAAIEAGADAAAFDEMEKALLRFTDAVVRDVKASETDFTQVAKQLSHRALCELLLVIGFYMMVSRFLENLEVDIESADLLSKGVSR